MVSVSPEEILETHQQKIYSCVAALTFCTYDTMLSLDHEIKYIWGSKWSLITVLYFIVRYYSAIGLITIIAIIGSPNLSVEACQGYFWWSIAGIPPIFILALDTILLLRIFALYGHSTRVFTILLILVVGNFAASQGADIVLAREIVAGIVVMPTPFQRCVSEPELSYTAVLVAYLPDLTLSVLFLVMTIRKLVVNHQNLHGKLSWRLLYDKRMVSPLLLSFVRDGSIFFALKTVIGFYAVFSLFVLNGPTQPVFYPWMLALYSYSGAHLILGLRATGARGNTDQTSNDVLSTLWQFDGVHQRSSIEFA